MYTNLFEHSCICLSICATAVPHNPRLICPRLHVFGPQYQALFFFFQVISIRSIQCTTRSILALGLGVITLPLSHPHSPTHFPCRLPAMLLTGMAPIIH